MKEGRSGGGGGCHAAFSPKPGLSATEVSGARREPETGTTAHILANRLPDETGRGVGWDVGSHTCVMR